MGKRTRSWVLAVVTALAASLAPGTAIANTITAEPGGNITATSLGRLSFNGSGGIEINCRVTLNGTIGSSINNARETSVGSITGGSTSECNTGSATFLLGTAWPLSLAEAAREERSPKLVNINMASAKIQVTVIGQTCLYEATLPLQLAADGLDESSTTRLVRILGNTARKVSGGIFCPATGELSGELSITRETLNFNAWRVDSESREDGAGRTVIRIEVTRQGGEVRITRLTDPDRWTITGLDCVRTFNRDTRCRATATEQVGARQATKSLVDDGGTTRLNLGLVP